MISWSLPPTGWGVYARAWPQGPPPSSLKKTRMPPRQTIDIQQVWREVLRGMEQRISRQNYEFWLSNITPAGIHESTLILQVPSPLFQSWLEHNYRAPLLEEIGRHAPAIDTLQFVTPEVVDEGTPLEGWGDVTTEVNPTPTEDNPPTGRVDANKTFDTFVIGSSNQFAAAAARAVADNPAKTYNPLFIFGGVGLGKTHLLNAIGNELTRRSPNTRVCYVSSEEFVNEIINSLRYGRMNEFRNKYRNNCDALLVDDIQFLAGKIRTQEEFFYTFNALHTSGRQIVVTSDKFPREIQGLEERLRNRFEWGLIADIQPPDDETKVAILKKKAASERLHLPDDVCHYLASVTKSNIRELEGILNRLVAQSAFYQRPVDLAFTQEALRHILDDQRPEPTVEIIQEAVARFYNLKVADLRSQRKHKQLVWPRQIAMFLSRKHTHRSFPEIGQRFGGRDHTTVIHAVKKIEAALEQEPELKSVLKSIENTIGV